MICQNCQKQIPDKAKVCLYCEAPVEPEPTQEEMDLVLQMLGGMPPDALADLRRVIEESATADDFVNAIFVGECPKCGSSETGDCENDPDIDDLLTGRCFACGQLFCTECLRLLTPEKPSCDCADEEEELAERN